MYKKRISIQAITLILFTLLVIFFIFTMSVNQTLIALGDEAINLTYSQTTYDYAKAPLILAQEREEIIIEKAEISKKVETLETATGTSNNGKFKPTGKYADVNNEIYELLSAYLNKCDLPDDMKDPLLWASMTAGENPNYGTALITGVLYTADGTDYKPEDIYEYNIGRAYDHGKAYDSVATFNTNQAGPLQMDRSYGVKKAKELGLFDVEVNNHKIVRWCEKDKMMGIKYDAKMTTNAEDERVDRWCPAHALAMKIGGIVGNYDNYLKNKNYPMEAKILMLLTSYNTGEAFLSDNAQINDFWFSPWHNNKEKMLKYFLDLSKPECIEAMKEFAIKELSNSKVPTIVEDRQLYQFLENISDKGYVDKKNFQVDGQKHRLVYAIKGLIRYYQQYVLYYK